MKTMQKKAALYSAIVCSLFALCPPAVRAQRITPSASQGGVSWQVTAPNDGVSLRVSQPNGAVFEQRFASGQSPAFTSPSGVLPDGSYTYELRLSPVVSKDARTQTEPADAENERLASPSGSVESGTFRVVGGVVKLPDASAVEPPSNPNDPPSPLVTDVDDILNITGQNVRTNFNDDSTTGGGNPDRNWQIRINEFSGGTANFFAIVDLGADTTGGETGTIPFRIDAGAPADSLRVAANGNVGLGTAVPAQELHILATTDPTIRLEHTGGSGQLWDIDGNTAHFFVRNQTQGTLPFVVKAATGFVGLGTQSPAGHLHVIGEGDQLSIFQSSNNNAVQFRLQTNNINRRFVALNAAGDQQSQLLFGDNGAFDFLGTTASDVRMRFLANGNVGIGTPAPTHKLSVNGDASKPGGGSWEVFSDERLKNIKGEFKGGLDEIMKLTPIRYEYKPDNAIGLKSEGEHIGFGAAAVREVIPEAVTRNEAGYLMIDNDPILWTMLNAIKEQNTQIEDLKGQVKRLQAEVVLQAAAKKSSKTKVAKSDR